MFVALHGPENEDIGEQDRRGDETYTGDTVDGHSWWDGMMVPGGLGHISFEIAAEEEIAGDADLSNSHSIGYQMGTCGKPESRQEFIMWIDKRSVSIVDQEERRYEEHVEADGTVTTGLQHQEVRADNHIGESLSHKEGLVESGRCEEDCHQRANQIKEKYVELGLHVIS